MSFEPRDYLHHILDEVEYLLATRSGLTYETFESDARSDGPLSEASKSSVKLRSRSRRAFAPSIRRSSGVRWQACATA